MGSVLYASMDVLDVDECNMPRVCESASMSDNPLCLFLDPLKHTIRLTYVISQVINLVKLTNLG